MRIIWVISILLLLSCNSSSTNNTYLKEKRDSTYKSISNNIKLANVHRDDSIRKYNDSVWDYKMNLRQEIYEGLNRLFLKCHSEYTDCQFAEIAYHQNALLYRTTGEERYRLEANKQANNFIKHRKNYIFLKNKRDSLNTLINTNKQ